MDARHVIGLGMLFLAGACAAPEATRPAPAVRPPAQPRYSPAGLETVIGRTAAYLVDQFGKPQLDIREGPARKLQFTGPACVLDAYLYPPEGKGEPIVTWVDARRSDGADFDRASCVAALTRRKEAR